MVTGWPNLANPADSVFFFILGISVALLLLNTAFMIYFVIRYSRKRNPHPEDIKENLPIEITWTVIPTILVLLIFLAGWKGFVYMRTVPPDAMPVKVTARQWSWLFEYPNGKQDSVLRVPLHKPVKLLLTSADVLHSLYIPAYRIKEDCVPGMNTYLWFQPDTPGSYDLFCTEYCGVAHADMITKVEVMPKEDFDAWYTEAAVAPEKPAPPAKKKIEAARPDVEGLLNVKGCLACHSLDGTQRIGPTFKGAYGRTVTVVTSGKERELVADDEYLKKSLLDPQADVVKGFPPIMPSQKGLLTDKELEDIIGYLKSLK